MALKGSGTTDRLCGLRRFAIAITLFNILGHTVFGFEQAWILPFTGVGTAYLVEILFELIEARAQDRKLRFAGGWRNLVDFLLSAHITGVAVAMLLYPNARVMPVVFATAVAIISKSVFRVQSPNGSRHFLNPSNFGISVTLLLFPFVGIAAPYHFTENLAPWASWFLPAVIIGSGSFLNAVFTKRIYVALGWVGGFCLQAVLRHWIAGSSFRAALVPMTGVAFVLFTFYMVTDPATTPCKSCGQLFFGASVALIYGLLVTLHVVFGFFFGLTAVSLVRGIALYAHQYASNTADQGFAAQAAMVFMREIV